MNDQEINKFLAEKLMGCHKEYRNGIPVWITSKGSLFTETEFFFIWNPARDISVALNLGGPNSVVGKMNELGWYYHQQQSSDFILFQTTFSNFTTDKSYSAEDIFPSRSICLAAIATLKGENK